MVTSQTHENLTLSGLENPRQFLEGYFDVWNTPLSRLDEGSDDLQQAIILMSNFVADSCTNRFQLPGPAGMIETVKMRRLAFPNFVIKLQEGEEPELKGNRLKAKLNFYGNLNGDISIMFKDLFIDVDTEVEYLLNDEGKIIGGDSNMRQKILEFLGNNYNGDPGALANFATDYF